MNEEASTQPAQETTAPPPEPPIALGTAIESALESRVQETSQRLAVDRASAVVEREHQRPARERQSIALYPFTDRDEVHLLGLGLAAASIERAACAAIVKQMVDAETYERIAKKLRMRGPLGDAQWKAFRMTARWEEVLHDTLTTLAVAAPDAKTKDATT